MARFDSAINLADRLITKNGETSTIVRPGATVPVAASPWERDAAPDTTQTVAAVWLDFDLRRVDGVLVKRGDQRVLVPAKGTAFTPDASTDYITRASGDRWEIESVKELNPNGQSILFELQVRR